MGEEDRVQDETGDDANEDIGDTEEADEEDTCIVEWNEC